MLTRHSGGLLEDSSGAGNMPRPPKSERGLRAERTNRVGKKTSQEDERKRRSKMTIAASLAMLKANAGRTGINRRVAFRLPQLLMQIKDHQSARVPLLERAKSGVGFTTTILGTPILLDLANGEMRNADWRMKKCQKLFLRRLPFLETGLELLLLPPPLLPLPLPLEAGENRKTGIKEVVRNPHVRRTEPETDLPGRIHPDPRKGRRKEILRNGCPHRDLLPRVTARTQTNAGSRVARKSHIIANISLLEKLANIWTPTAGVTWATTFSSGLMAPYMKVARSRFAAHMSRIKTLEILA